MRLNAPGFNLTALNKPDVSTTWSNAAEVLCLNSTKAAKSLEDVHKRYYRQGLA